MPSTSRIDIRLTEEEKTKAKEQAEKLGTDISGYIKLIINLDMATNIVACVWMAAKEIERRKSE